MTLPRTGQPHEGSSVRLSGADASTQLPNLYTASEAALLGGVRSQDPLALAEIYQRTSVTAHAVIRRLLGGVDVDAVLCAVYVDLWASPPDAEPLGSWVRGRSFDLAAEELRRRSAGPASASVRLLLEDLPAAKEVHTIQAEQELASLPEDHRRALCLAHDRGVSTAQQGGDAALLVEAALLALGRNETQAVVAPNGDDAAADYVLDLLPADEAATVAAAAAEDEALAARIQQLRRGRRRLEGLPPTPHLGHRVVAHVVGARDRAAVSAEPEAVAAQPDEVKAPASEPLTSAGPANRMDGPVPRRSHVRVMALLSAAAMLIIAANVLVLTSRQLPAANARPAVAVAEAQQRGSQTSPPSRPRVADRATPVRKKRKGNKTPRIVAPRAIAPVAPPVNIDIPAMGIDKRLVELGLQPDGRLASPVDYADPGWYRDGVAPGESGPAVIVGHVDSLDGPAIFYELKTLQKGDRVRIARADGTKATFVIDRVERFPKENFPSQQVYGDTARPELRLITCGGGFNNTTRHYDDNVVAFAHMIKGGRGKSGSDNERAGREENKDSRRSDSGGSERPEKKRAGRSESDATSSKRTAE